MNYNDEEEFEQELDDDIEEELDEEYKNEKDIHQQVMVVTTEGVTHDIYNGFDAMQRQNMFMCNLCTKYFRNDMKVNWDGVICMHCFFWLHYSEGLRTQIDGIMGTTIAQYILKCRGNHKIETCTKNTDMGGCFICDNLNGINIDKIKTPELVNTHAVPDKKETDALHISDDDFDVDGGVTI